MKQRDELAAKLAWLEGWRDGLIEESSDTYLWLARLADVAKRLRGKG